MQFVLLETPVIQTFVDLTVPGNAPAQIILEFKYQVPKIFAEWFEYHRQCTGLSRVKQWIKKAVLWILRKPMPTMREICLQGVIGWQEVYDKNGAELPFNQANFEMLLNGYPKAASEIVMAYMHAVLEGHQKN